MKLQRLLFCATAFLSLISCNEVNNNNNGDWLSRSAYAGADREYAAAFSIGTNGYVGSGYDGTYYLSDWWAWSQVENTWTQIAAMPGNPRAYAVGFATTDMGYCGTGYDGITFYNDFYQYNPATNSWTQIPNIPVPMSYGEQGRMGSMAIGIGTNGYVLGGFDSHNADKDFYIWNETAGTWTTTDYPGPKRQFGVAFTHGVNGYVVTGLGDSGSPLTDMWTYNTSTNTWTQLRYIGGVTDQAYDAGYQIVRQKAVAFTMNNSGIPKAYLALGQNGGLKTDCWEYDFASDLWYPKTNFPGGGRIGAVGLTVNDSGYLGLGASSSLPLGDFTQFYPALPYNPDDYIPNQ